MKHGFGPFEEIDVLVDSRDRSWESLLASPVHYQELEFMSEVLGCGVSGSLESVECINYH